MDLALNTRAKAININSRSGWWLEVSLSLTDSCFEFWRVRVIGDRDHDLHVVGCGPPLELALGLDHDLDTGVGVPLYHRLDPDQGLDVGVEPGKYKQD